MLGMIKQRNINSYFIQREGGRLYGIAKTDQHEYDDVIWPKGVKPLVASLIRTFLISLGSLDQTCLKSSKHSYLKGAPLVHCSHEHLCSKHVHDRFWIETTILLEVLLASREAAYVQHLSSPCHHRHLRLRRISIFHALGSFSLLHAPSWKAYNCFSHINLIIIHTETFDNRLSMVHIFTTYGLWQHIPEQI
jgi:hypothetical protein